MNFCNLKSKSGFISNILAGKRDSNPEPHTGTRLNFFPIYSGQNCECLQFENLDLLCENSNISNIFSGKIQISDLSTFQ